MSFSDALCVNLRHIFIREIHQDDNLPNSRQGLLSGEKQSDSINISLKFWELVFFKERGEQ